jgi:hypothetical protein
MHMARNARRVRIRGSGILRFSLALIGALIGAASPLATAPAAAAPLQCPQTSSQTTQASTVLEQFATSSNAGIVYDGTTAQLRLKKAGGSFKSTNLTVTDIFNMAAVGDFDEDGWTDMVVASTEDKFIRFYKNRTYENPAPNWADATKIRTPKFVRTVDIEPSSASAAARGGMAAGDFNNDGNLDFFYAFSAPNNSSYYVHLDIQKIYLGKGNGTFNAGYNATSNVAALGYLIWAGTNVAVYDYNRDGWPDIVYGTKLGTSDSTGAVVVMINGCPTAWSPTTKCAVNPTFSVQNMKTGLNYGSNGVNALAIGDFTGDNIADLVLGSPSFCGSSNKPLRVFPGLSGGGFDSNYQGITTSGAAAVIVAADYSLDGKLDIVYGSDNWQCGDSLGGNSYYLKNNNTSTPFSAGNTQQLSSHQAEVAGNLYDFDFGIALDYDHDPEGTPDFIMADGNHSGSFFVFANRVVTTFVDCGEVASGVLDLGNLAATEMVVTGARLSPVQSLPSGTTVNYYLSNEDPANWQLAAPCTDNTTQYCATFPKPVGRTVRWRATACSDSTKTKTPTITSIGVKFDYTPAKEHYRAGVIVSDGVSYVGAFRQPGERGHFYAINAGLSTRYWDFATKLDAMSDSSRNLYTATVDGATRLDFTTAMAADTRMQSTLGVGSTDQASAIIDWVRSKRFGYTSTTVAQSKLGSIETSTPAVLTPPGIPSWYVHASPADRQAVDQFLATHAKRPQLVMFGSKDGVFHGVRTIPTSITSAESGREIWGFIPPKVAFGFSADRAASSATFYPDGSPSVADVKINGALRTVAVVNGGNGSKGVFGLDVTSTYTLSSPNVPSSAVATIPGPTPLWHSIPGDSNAGQSYAKPAIARVKLGGVETYLAIMASGRASDNAAAPWTKGKEVVAVNVATGATAWQFTTKCPVTSDIVIFETDDDAEPGDPELDGYADRMVVADYCGFVYKLALAEAPTAGRLKGRPRWAASARSARSQAPSARAPTRAAA